MATAPSNTGVIEIARIDSESIRVPIVGTSPLIMHRFPEKAKKQMLDAQQGRKSPKVVRDPEADYQAAFHRLKDGGYGIPAAAFKKATVGGARFYSAITMTALRQFLFFRGEIGADGQMLNPVVGDPHMREDFVRINNGRGTDLRYRPEFPEWSTTLEVVYVTSALTRDSVLSLIDAGGLGVGVLEWRPEKGGEFGTYRIDPTREVEVLP